MIYLIIKSYLAILLSVGTGSILIFIVGLYFIFRRSKSKLITTIVTAEHSHQSGFTNDLTAIAGDDIMATQLDLARAYIETDKKQSAKTILEYVVKQGNVAQREEAQQLLNYI